MGPERPEHAAARLSFSSSSHVMKQQRRELPVSGVKTKYVLERSFALNFLKFLFLSYDFVLCMFTG